MWSHLQEKKILNFIKEKYTPYNSVVSICGNFDAKELEELLEKYFGNWHSDDNYLPIYNDVEIEINSGYAQRNRTVTYIFRT